MHDCADQNPGAKHFRLGFDETDGTAELSIDSLGRFEGDEEIVGIAAIDDRSDPRPLQTTRVVLR